MDNGYAPGGIIPRSKPKLSFLYNYAKAETTILLDSMLVEKTRGQGFWQVVKDYRQNKESLRHNIAKSSIHQDWYEVEL